MTRRELPTVKKSITGLMASRFNMEPQAFHTTLMNTVMPKGKSVPSQAEVAAFLTVAHEYELNPFTKQIYAFPAKGGGIVPMVGIDGWIAIAERNLQMDGFTFDYIEGEDGKLRGVTCRIHRKDRAHPIEATEWLEECSRGTDPWRQMPRRMLRNKALGQAIRMAFGVCGIYDEDEARDVAGERVPEYAEKANVEEVSALDEFEPQEIEPPVIEQEPHVEEFNQTQEVDNAFEGFQTANQGS